MSDADFMRWLADRLVNVYGESPDVDFVRRVSSLARPRFEMDAHTCRQLELTARGCINALHNLCDALRDARELADSVSRLAALSPEPRP